MYYFLYVTLPALILITLAVFCVYSLFKARKEPKKFLPLILLLVVLVLRFGPFLFGREWRESFRQPLDILTGVVLVLWSIAWFFVEKGVLKRLPILLTALVAFFLLGARFAFPHVHESVVESGAGGRPIYISENPESGSLAYVQCYPYINEVFRGLNADHGSYEHGVYGYDECHKYP